MSKWIEQGDIRVSKKGNLYIKLSEELSKKLGTETLNLVKHSDNIQGLVTKGFITQEEADERIEKTSFIKYKIFKAPNEKK